MRTAFTEELHRTRPAASESDLDSGGSFALGHRVRVGSATGKIYLYYVKGGAGTPTDGDVVGGGSPHYTPAASDEEVAQAANSGEMEWVYVRTAEAITRGQIVIDNALGTPYVVKAYDIAADGDVARVRGVAQHNIPSGYSGWVLVKGRGVIAVTSTVAAGAALEPDASGDGVAISAGTAAVNIGFALEADSATTYADVDSKNIIAASIDCRG